MVIKRSFLLTLAASVAGILMLAGTSLAASAAPVGPTSGQSAAAASLVSSAGTITASLVPDTGIKPASATGTSGNVTIILVGSGLHLDSWTMTAAPLAPGDCTYGAFWVAGEIWELAPEKCNDTDEDATYVASISDIDFSGDAQVCNTAVGLSGKPCEEVYG